MSELINTIFIFFTDKTKKLSHKTIMIFFSLILLIFLDNTFSFSYYYNNASKVEQIEKLNNIVLDSTLTVSEIKQLKILRHNIIKHNTWKDQIYNKIISFDFRVNDNNKIIVKNDKRNNIKERNYWIHFISSSWFFCIMMLIIPIAAIFDKKNSSLSLIFAIIFIFEPLLYLFSWFFAKLFSFIPIIDNTPYYNYAINGLLHIIILLILGFFINKYAKKTD